MADFTPETGYPLMNEGFGEEDRFEFAPEGPDGKRVMVTGAHLNMVMDAWKHSPRGRSVLDPNRLRVYRMTGDPSGDRTALYDPSIGNFTDITGLDDSLDAAGSEILGSYSPGTPHSEV